MDLNGSQCCKVGIKDLFDFVFLLLQILKQLISLVENPNEYTWKGYVFSALLFLVYSTSTTFYTTYLTHMYCVAVTVSFSLLTAIISPEFPPPLRVNISHFRQDLWLYLLFCARCSNYPILQGKILLLAKLPIWCQWMPRD